MSFTLKLENIREKQTKEYMKEVISSYENSNFRSCIVMLYSVVITDLMLKMVELSDIYSDDKAGDMVNKLRGKDRYNAQRENDLIDFVSKSTKFLSNEVFATINFLKDLRNVSAHPNFEPLQIDILPSPDGIVVAGLINTCIEKIFSVPPFIGNNNFEFILEELSKRKSDLSLEFDTIDKTRFDAFFGERYYKVISNTSIDYYIEQFFKIVFVTESAEAKENRDVNYLALKYLQEKQRGQFFKIISVSKHIKQINYFSEDFDFDKLLIILFEEPRLFKYLSEDLQAKIKEEFRDSALTYYLNDNSEFSSYIEKNPEITFGSVRSNEADEIIKYLLEIGQLDALKKVSINTYVKSFSYDKSAANFRKFIAPFLERFNLNDFHTFFDEANTNAQNYERRGAAVDHKLAI